VAFTDDGQRLVGIPAKRQVSSHSRGMSDPLLMPSTTPFLILFLFININRLSQIQNIQFSQVRDSLVEDSMMSQLKKIWNIYRIKFAEPEMVMLGLKPREISTPHNR